MHAPALLTQRSIVTAIFVGLLAYLFVWPFLTLIAGAFLSSPFEGGTLTLEGFADVFLGGIVYGRLGTSALYSGLVMVASISAGLYFATVSTRLPVRTAGLITITMVLIAAIPRLFYAVSWGMMGSPRSGLLANLLMQVGIRTPDWLTVYSWPGLVMVTALKVTAIAYLLLIGPVGRIDRSLEDAAVMCGESRPRAFFEITLPLLTPALLAVGMLLFVEGMQAFDFPALLGTPAGIHTLSTTVNDFIVKEVQPNWSAASALSLVVIVLIGLLLVVQERMTAGRSFVTVTGKSRQAEAVRLGWWSWLIDLSVVCFILLALVLPVAQMIIGSLQPFFGLYGTYSGIHYVNIFSNGSTLMMIFSSLGIAVGGGFAVVALAFTMTMVIQRTGSPALARFVRIASWLPATAPGIVLSLSFVWAYLRTPWLRELYGTPWLMLLALVVAHIPIAARAIEGIVAQVSPELEEAARISGAPAWLVALEVTAKLCAPSLMGAWLLVSLAISGALDIPLLLQTTKTQTVATRAFSLFNNGEIAEAAALYCSYLGIFLAIVALGALVRREITKIRAASQRVRLEQSAYHRGEAHA